MRRLSLHHERKRRGEWRDEKRLCWRPAGSVLHEWVKRKRQRTARRRSHGVTACDETALCVHSSPASCCCFLFKRSAMLGRETLDKFSFFSFLSVFFSPRLSSSFCFLFPFLCFLYPHSMFPPSSASPLLFVSELIYLPLLSCLSFFFLSPPVVPTCFAPFLSFLLLSCNFPVLSFPNSFFFSSRLLFSSLSPLLSFLLLSSCHSLPFLLSSFPLLSCPFPFSLIIFVLYSSNLHSFAFSPLNLIPLLFLFLSSCLLFSLFLPSLLFSFPFLTVLSLFRLSFYFPLLSSPFLSSPLLSSPLSAW